MITVSHYMVMLLLTISCANVQYKIFVFYIMQSNYQEYLQLKSRFEQLKHSQRYFTMLNVQQQWIHMYIYIYILTFGQPAFSFYIDIMIVNIYLAFCRQLLGEDIGDLGISDLERLERQLDNSVRQIRSRKVARTLKISSSYFFLFL